MPIVAAMKDRELGELPHPSSLPREEELRRLTKPLWVLMYWGWGLMFMAAVFTIVTTLFGRMTYPPISDKQILCK